MHRGVFILLALAPLYTACSTLTPAHSPDAPEASPIKTWKALRDDGLEKQRTDESCGSASAATILRAFYEVDVSEPDQPIIADSPHYGKVVLTPVSEMHDHGDAQGCQVMKPERGPASPKSVWPHGVREIGEGGPRELGERAILEAP